MAEAPAKASESRAASPSPNASAQPLKAADINSTIADHFLKRFPATYDYNAVLNDPLIQQPLRELLGTEYDHFIENLSGLRGPIDVISGTMALDGARNDLPARENAVLCISFHPLKLHAGIYSNNAMTVYSSTAKYEHLPKCIQRWVFIETHGETGIDRPPAQGESEFTFALKVVHTKP